MVVPPAAAVTTVLITLAPDTSVTGNAVPDVATVPLIFSVAVPSVVVGVNENDLEPTDAV